MSGSFEGAGRAPTLVSFATAIGNTRDAEPRVQESQQLDRPSCAPTTRTALPEIGSLVAIYKTVEQMIDEGKVLAAATLSYGGVGGGAVQNVRRQPCSACSYPTIST